MGLFDSLQNLIGGVTDLAQGSIQDVVGGISEIPGAQEVQDLASGATEIVSSAAEQGKTTVEDITQNIGL